MKLKELVYDVLASGAEDGADDPLEYDKAVMVAAGIVKQLCDFCEEHDLALPCGSEWLFQSDEGQVDALELVGNILDSLEEFADEIN